MRRIGVIVVTWAAGTAPVACSATSRNNVDEVEVSGGAAGEAASPTTSPADTTTGRGGAPDGGSETAEATTGAAGALHGDPDADAGNGSGSTGSGGMGGDPGSNDTTGPSDPGDLGSGGITTNEATVSTTTTTTGESETGSGGTTDVGSTAETSGTAGTTASATSSTTTSSTTTGSTTTGSTTTSSTTTSSTTTGSTTTCTPDCGGGNPVCLDGTCVECAPNATPTNCNDETPEYCDDTGHWQPSAAGPCQGGETCNRGACVCAGTECGSVCVDTATDTNNCGACGHSCQTGACIDGKCQPVVLAAGRDEPWGIAVSNDYLYWVDRGSGVIYRLTLADGSASPLSATDWHCAFGNGSVAVDGSYVYWDGVYVCRQPHSGGADESLGEPLWTMENYAIQSLAVNSTSVYALNVTDNWLTSLDQGTYQAPQNPQVAIAADDAGLYWLQWSTSSETGQVVGTAPTTINSGSTVLANRIVAPQGIAVYGNRVYWTESSSPTEPTGAVYSVSTGGLSVQTIATEQANPSVIAVDSSGIYWTNRSETDGAVMRASFLGGDGVAIAIDQSGPNGITLDSKAVYWTNSGGGEVMKLAK